MTYREFVERPSAIMDRIKHQIEDVKLKESACQNITSSFKERVQTSPVNNTELSYLRYIEAKRRLDNTFGELKKAQDELRSFFERNLKQDEADFLEWKYVDCKSVHEIAIIKEVAYQTAKNKVSKADRKAMRIWAEKSARYFDF